MRTPHPHEISAQTSDPEDDRICDPALGYAIIQERDKNAGKKKNEGYPTEQCTGIDEMESARP
jgi:hypothetical protein